MDANPPKISRSRFSLPLLHQIVTVANYNHNKINLKYVNGFMCDTSHLNKLPHTNNHFDAIGFLRFYPCHVL